MPIGNEEETTRNYLQYVRSSHCWRWEFEPWLGGRWVTCYCNVPRNRHLSHKPVPTKALAVVLYRSRCTSPSLFLYKWKPLWRFFTRFPPPTVLKDTLGGHSGQNPVFLLLLLLWRHRVYRLWQKFLKGALAGDKGQASEVGPHGGGLESDFWRSDF